MEGAIRNLFPDVTFSEGESVVGTARDLERLAELLRQQRIRAAAREVLQGAVRGARLAFGLNKQAAYAGRVSFASYSPLGEISVVIETDDAAGVVDRLAPRPGPPRS